MNLSQLATTAAVSAIVLFGSACSTNALVPQASAMDGTAVVERSNASLTSATASPTEPAALPSAVVAAPTPVVPLASTALAADETQVARYTTVSAAPGEADANPLAVVAKVHFPREVVVTVGDAVRYLLIRTGYRLLPAERMLPAVSDVFALPLPDNQRVLGPYRVEALLGVLMGKPYTLRVDPALRTISYDTTSTAMPRDTTDPALPKASSLLDAVPASPGTGDPVTADRTANAARPI